MSRPNATAFRHGAAHAPPAASPPNARLIDLGIDLSAYDDATSISLTQARNLIRGRSGRINLQVARRWASPHRGYRPLGPDGPVIVLPAVKVSGQLCTMPAWVEAFERARIGLVTRDREQRAAELREQAGRVRAPRERELAYRQACARLDAAGIGGGKRPA